MSVDISFGVLVHHKDRVTVEWLQFKRREKDGSNIEINPRAGFPLRKCSTPGFINWLHEDPAAEQIWRAVKREHPTDQTPEWSPITDELIELSKGLRVNGGCNPFHADRARWLQFWMRRAKEHWGASAVIMFS